jgi:hypothetical protein
MNPRAPLKSGILKIPQWLSQKVLSIHPDESGPLENLLYFVVFEFPDRFNHIQSGLSRKQNLRDNLGELNLAISPAFAVGKLRLRASRPAGR